MESIVVISNVYFCSLQSVLRLRASGHIPGCKLRLHCFHCNFIFQSDKPWIKSRLGHSDVYRRGGISMVIILIHTVFITYWKFQLDYLPISYIWFGFYSIILGEIRQLKYLVPFSAIANLCILITFAITLFYMLTGPLHIHERPLFSSWGQLPLFFRY